MRKCLSKIELLKITVCLFIILGSINITKAAVVSYTKNQDGVTFKLDKGLMFIRVCMPDIVEVKYTILNAFPQKASLVVNNEWKTKTAFKVSDQKGAIVITTSKLNINIDKVTNAITYTDLKGSVIISESSGNKSMKAATIAGIETYNCNTQFNSPGDEALYGLGCHPEDSLSINYKGRDQTLEIKYMTGAIPVLLSTKGYGLLWDNYAASKFYGTQAGNTKYKYVSESGNMVDYYFFYG